MKIIVFVRGVRENKKAYPANAQTARIIGKLTQHKTLSLEQLEILKHMGNEVVEIPDPQFVLDWA